MPHAGLDSVRMMGIVHALRTIDGDRPGYESTLCCQTKALVGSIDPG